MSKEDSRYDLDQCNVLSRRMRTLSDISRPKAEKTKLGALRIVQHKHAGIELRMRNATESVSDKRIWWSLVMSNANNSALFTIDHTPECLDPDCQGSHKMKDGIINFVARTLRRFQFQSIQLVRNLEMEIHDEQFGSYLSRYRLFRVVGLLINADWLLWCVVARLNHRIEGIWEFDTTREIALAEVNALSGLYRVRHDPMFSETTIAIPGTDHKARIWQSRYSSISIFFN
ncbi:hypothetical protein PRIPAC_86823 [Pristionchus pacificus]|uniref:Uncharacterized protein n=1 Tax=Pristionchus pacificus TaxID=54126 RepID=A0A2A6BK66_PRIPA|nr:hypothetical protein PRIPAC_86823 [Pristionchus pacificus]|eukprot:PDM66314.1 hypothetical protein PRIPAC_47731 [Pristionchus pacificus]